nr:hypothetical protein [Methanoculleus sp.]
MATFAPSSANLIAVARPMPVEPPVTRTFFPSSRLLSSHHLGGPGTPPVPAPCGQGGL